LIVNISYSLSVAWQKYIYEDSSRWNFAFNYYVLLTRADMHTKKVVSWVLVSFYKMLILLTVAL